MRTAIKEENKMKQTLYNGCSDNCCAYCKLHHCSMTVRQMKIKECLQKQCWHLDKNEEHPYWRQRDVMKQKRKARKDRINQQYLAVAML